MKMEIGSYDDRDEQERRRRTGFKKSDDLTLTPAGEKGSGHKGLNGATSTAEANEAQRHLPDQAKPQTLQERREAVKAERADEQARVRGDFGKTTKASYRAMREAEENKKPEETKAANLNTLEVRERIGGMLAERQQGRKEGPRLEDMNQNNGFVRAAMKKREAEQSVKPQGSIVGSAVAQHQRNRATLQARFNESERHGKECAERQAQAKAQERQKELSR